MPFLYCNPLQLNVVREEQTVSLMNLWITANCDDHVWVSYFQQEIICQSNWYCNQHAKDYPATRMKPHQKSYLLKKFLSGGIKSFEMIIVSGTLYLRWLDVCYTPWQTQKERFLGEGLPAVESTALSNLPWIDNRKQFSFTCTIANLNNCPLSPTAIDEIAMRTGPRTNFSAIAKIAFLVPHAIILAWDAMKTPVELMQYE